MEKAMWGGLTTACAVLIQLWSGVVAYNLDTKFPVIYSSSLGDYFGYTVALHKNKNGPMALVGAPRANSTILLNRLHQPGVLFKCDILLSSNDKRKCEEVNLHAKDSTNISYGGEFSYYNKKDDMWLGVSLDIQPNQPQNDIVTCGHLWKNQIYRGEHYVNGICYVINSDLEPNSVRKLMPLIQVSKQVYNRRSYYSLGVAGASAAYSEDGKSLILGAPGLYDFIGGVVSYPTDPRNSMNIYKNPTIPYPSWDFSKESYLGYSVTSGKFFNDNDIFYAVGAPRDNKKHGRVYMFKALNQRNKYIVVHHTKEGTQFGEYFGAAVLGINLNGDAYTDLLVGAPFYSLEAGGDEGKVVVYISKGQGLETYLNLFGDSKPNARFGTTIANVGDLNQDGYNDVAIGAPYEDGKGAVYIYHGAETGMNVQYVQKIKASSISPKLSGFGIHISRGVDIDNNRYPDILIGSYASSNAVLFRTHPVVQLSPKLIFSPKQIANLTDCEFNGETLRCVNVSACLWYTGKHVPLSLDLENDILVDFQSQGYLRSPRGFFVHSGKEMSMISESTKLEIGVQKCIKRSLYIHADIKDVITPIQILFRYRLAVPPRANETFNKLFPIIDPFISTNVSSAITFQTGCSQDDRCLSDLVVLATLDGDADGQLTLGEVSSVSLSITVKNKGDPAFLTELLIYLPPDTPSINQDFCVSSSQRPNVDLICELGNLPDNAEVKVHIKLDATKIPTGLKKLDIVLEVVTASTEITPENNSLNITLHLQTIADMGITAASAQEKILYDEDDNFGRTKSISHTYTVRNHGPSPLETIDIIIYVPIAFLHSTGRKQFLSFTSLETDSRKQLSIPAQCNSTYLKLQSATPEVKTQVQAVDEERNSSRSVFYNHSSEFLDRPNDVTMDFRENNLIGRTKRNSETSKMTSSKAQKTILITCDNENIECIALQCSASPFTDIRKIAQIAVTAEVNMTKLSNYLGSWFSVEFETVGKIAIRDENVKLLDEHSDIAQVKTMFIYNGLPPSEELASWIIIVSILAGVLLLLIILIILIKLGFFKRKQMEKMKELRKSVVHNNYDTMEVETAENDDLN